MVKQNINMRDFSITRNKGEWYHAKVTDSYGNDHHLGYWKHYDFLEDIEKRAEEIWANEVNEEDLMNKAITECIELDKKNGLLKGNRDNLD